MPNIITVKKKKEIKISRGVRGGAVIKIDAEAADVLEELLSKAGGALGVKELASSMIKYAANDTIISVEEGDD